jgi:ubiquinone/menaquinone biosynthesis C-methylase UbiE
MKKQIDYNEKIHNFISKKYDSSHPEIFNDIEQERLMNSIKKISSLIKTKSKSKFALDVGCGSGNLTHKFLEGNFYTMAADISQNFLNLIKKKYPTEKNLKLVKLNGKNLNNIEDNSLDLVGSYSVLHHIPYYIGFLKEVSKKIKIGGILFIDHEANKNFWNKSESLKEYELKSNVYLQKNRWKNFLKPKNYYIKIRTLFNKRYRYEGDIHVFPDDHIEWDKIKKIMNDLKFEIILEEDYLLYSEGVPKKLYNSYKKLTSNTKIMAFRKKNV